MDSYDLSRRSVLQALASVIAAAATSTGWTEIVEALDHAHAARQTGATANTPFLTTAEAADLDAVTAQIVPTDDSPGAREAGVIYFIDRALATLLAQMASDYRAQISDFQAAYRRQYSGATSFASLTSEQQVDYLKQIDRTPFFATTHLLTMLGMFTSPEYGGNKDRVGWKLIGFEDAHAFYPPFGFYDRQYDGFLTDPAKAK